MERICGINCIYNEDEAKENKQKCIEKYKNNLRIGNVLDKINNCCIAGMVIALIAFLYMWSCVKFIDVALMSTFYPYMFASGITLVALFVISSILDIFVSDFSFCNIDDKYGLAEQYLTIKEKGDKITDAKIVVEEGSATFHLFVEEYDDIYGKVIKERKFENITIIKTENESRLDLNNETYFLKF